MEQNLLTSNNAGSEQHISVPEGAVVCVIGGPCEEKVTFLDNLLKNVPVPAVQVSSAKLFKKKFDMELDSLADHPIKVAQMGGMDVINAEYSELVTEKVIDGLQQPNTFVFDMPPSNVKEVSNFLSAVEILRQSPKVVLIKMDPKNVAHQGRHSLENGIDKIRWKIIQHKYRLDFSCVTGEHVVSDPARVKLNFT